MSDVNEQVVDQQKNGMSNEGESDSTSSTTQAASQSETKVNRYDELARAQGWVPKEEWQGDPDDWTDSKEFVRRGELFSKISNQSSEIKELRKAMTALVDHHNKVKETEFKRALDYLKQQKKSALEEGDADKLLQVEDAIDTLKTEQQREQQVQQNVPQEAQLSPVFVKWVDQNQWYIHDRELKTFADEIGTHYFHRNPGIPESEIYKYVLDRVKKAFPEKFSNNGRGTRTPNEVESGNTSSRGNVKKDNFKLTEEEERAMKMFIRQGIITKERYIEDIRKLRGE